ncbi:MAG: alpha/beta hydrolase-fold protein [Pseudomonadota bacterium]
MCLSFTKKLPTDCIWPRLASLFLSLSLLGLFESSQAGVATQPHGAFHTHTLQSVYPDQERMISVQLPPSYLDNPDRNYPVLYILDGQNNTEMATAIVGNLVASNSMPEIIIVGLHAGETRQRDYLPKNSEARRDGMASQFLKSIEHEVLPFIESEYRTSSYRVFSGHSFGGLFTLFAFTEKPELFDGYMAQSPGLDPEWVDYFFPRIKQTFEDHPTLDTSLFVVMGNEPWWQDTFDELLVLLSEEAPDTFQWGSDKHLEADHMETRAPGMRGGLGYIFSGQ